MVRRPHGSDGASGISQKTKKQKISKRKNLCVPGLFCYILRIKLRIFTHDFVYSAADRSWPISLLSPQEKPCKEEEEEAERRRSGEGAGRRTSKEPSPFTGAGSGGVVQVVGGAGRRTLSVTWESSPLAMHPHLSLLAACTRTHTAAQISEKLSH